MISFFRYVFWRFLHKPQVGEVYRLNLSPDELDGFSEVPRVEVVETLDNVVAVRYLRNGSRDLKPVRTLVAFYTLEARS